MRGRIVYTAEGLFEERLGAKHIGFMLDKYQLSKGSSANATSTHNPSVRENFQ